MAKTVFVRIRGIQCRHCVEVLTEGLSRLDGVKEVSIQNNVAWITADPPPSAEDIVAAVKSLGYDTDRTLISDRLQDLSGRLHPAEFLLIFFSA